MICTINLSTIYEIVEVKYYQQVYFTIGSTTNAVIISLQSKSIILEDLINKILKKKCNKDESSFFCIQNTTGTLLFNEIILKHKNVLILEHGLLETSCMDTLEDCLDNNKSKDFFILILILINIKL